MVRGPATPVRRAAGWSDPAFARVAEVVYLVAGLVFPPNRQPSAESGMRRAMTALRLVDPDALGRAVQAPGEARDTVLAELTVGETYFFREPTQLDLLGTHILPALYATRDPARALRIWSAGCASGEEPYTVAILLRELGWPHPTRILGTDVARPRLDAARRGRYTRWSLRGTSPARVARWFAPRGAQWQLDGGIRDAVEFGQLNLVADEYPSPATGTMAQDIVLCRNVLIYFDMEGVKRIASRLLESLAPDGWLLLGASDPPLAGVVPCETVLLPGGVAYRRTGVTDLVRPAIEVATGTAWWVSPATPPRSDAEPLHAACTPPTLDSILALPPEAPAPVPATSSTAAASDPALVAYASADYTLAESLAARQLEGDPSRVEPWIVLVRAIANQGRVRDAEVECIRALDLHRLSPELHYLHATLLREAGQPRESANAARRALYLDPGFVMAHLLLGDALAHLGEGRRARRAFENAQSALAAAAPDSVPLAADGVPAARLAQVAALRVETLGRQGVS